MQEHMTPSIAAAPGTPATPSLAQLLSLNTSGPGRYGSSESQSNARGAVFGGQLIGQALAAAALTVDADLPAHRLQLSFLRAGQPASPLQYEVCPLLEGRLFQVRQVLGLQGDRSVVAATVSFHRLEDGPAHAAEPTGPAPDPERLPRLEEVVRRIGTAQAGAALDAMAAKHTLDLRIVDAEQLLLARNRPARLRYWVRAAAPLPAAPALHQAALAYLSDYWLSLTALLPHPVPLVGHGLQVASLSHDLWFHAACRADDWLLVEAQSPASGGATGLTLANVFRRDGALVATLAQEALYRGWPVGRDNSAVV